MGIEKNFPLEDFCKQEICKCYLDMEKLKMYSNVGILNKKIAEKEISKIRKGYCSDCKATRYIIYLKSHSL
jgi:hypothetical protein